jgi:cytidine deaminase
MPTDADLIAAAETAMANAYARYSNFSVGAALVADDGRLFTGANVENASFGLTVCAERVAVFTAVAAGVRRIDRIAVVASSGEKTFPCGACRQVLHEFGATRVIVADAGAAPESHSLASLLPHAFDL